MEGGKRVREEGRERGREGGRALRVRLIICNSNQEKV
jgi:hypothetical protein